MVDGNDGQLKGIYRFFQNTKVTEQKVLETHYLNTIERMQAYRGKIHLLNDTCFVSPSKGMDGLLSRGIGKNNCVRTHYCLAVSEDKKHLFGILNFHSFSGPLDKKHPDIGNESDIWIKIAENCINLINASTQGKKLLSKCIFIADREGDEYRLLAFLLRNELSFIIRSQYDRRITFEGEEIKLSDALIDSSKHGRVYSISTNKNGVLVNVPVQRSVLRNILVPVPNKLPKSFNPLEINIVNVSEVTPKEKPVNWRLLTTEDVSTTSASQLVVNGYSNRWIIEEVNKAAKSGVSVEKRQFTDIDHYLPFLAMAFVVAWRMVALRTTVEVSPGTKINEAFTEDEVAYMQAEAMKKEMKMKNVKDALIFIARLGGYTGRYDRPGWQLLWQGWMKFYERVEGFITAKELYSI